MKIVFLCGSIEPGKDGVGDYSRRLASKLTQYGHHTVLISLNDGFVDIIENSTQTEEGVSISTVRLPRQLSITERVQTAKNFISAFEAEWVSLQYVPYAFHPKGLPFSWMKAFKRCAPQCKWHVMMHELWIGSKKKDSIKSKIIGFFQRNIVKRTLDNIHPIQVTSNVKYYKYLLQNINYRAHIIPVFNNIGIGNPDNTKLFSQLSSHFQVQDNVYLAVFFGGVYADEEIYSNISKLVEKAKIENRKVNFIHIGRSAIIASFFATLKTRYSCECFALGEQKSNDIAALLCRANFGVSTYSKEFMAKSGSIAAMLNNKLPVVLLKNMDILDDTDYSYVRHIDDINSLYTFCNQSKEWSDMYGLENSANFYMKLFTR